MTVIPAQLGGGRTGGSNQLTPTISYMLGWTPIHARSFNDSSDVTDGAIPKWLLDRSERFHSECVEVLSELSGALVTCEACVAEACYLLRDVRGAPEAAISSVEKLLKKYRDLPMDLADACLVDLADRLETGRILTLDRDFEVYRWQVRRKLEWLISL